MRWGGEKREEGNPSCNFSNWGKKERKEKEGTPYVVHYFLARKG